MKRKTRLTRLGFHFLFVGSFAMLGGALRGFNLLLVLAGLLVGAMIVQWRWSRRSVEAVSVNRRLPTEAFVGKPFRVRYLLRNHSRLIPAWMMRIEDKIESIDHADVTTAVCAAGVVSAGQTVQPHFECVVTRRGLYRFGPSGLMTTFPFSLLSYSRIGDDVDQLHVFPELLTLTGDWRRRLISRAGGVATTGRRSGPSEGDFFGLREWKNGDSPKWIHWRTSARLSQPVVRQFEQQRRFDTCVLVDAFESSIAGRPLREKLEPMDQPPSKADVELAISLAATFVVHLVGSPSNRVVLAVAAKQSDAIMCAGSVAGKRRMLEVLADLVPSQRPSIPDATLKTLRIVGNMQDLIVVSPRALADAKQADPLLTETLAPWVRRGALRWIDISDGELDRWIVPPARKESAKVPA